MDFFSSSRFVLCLGSGVNLCSTHNINVFLVHYIIYCIVVAEIRRREWTRERTNEWTAKQYKYCRRLRLLMNLWTDFICCVGALFEFLTCHQNKNREPNRDANGNRLTRRYALAPIHPDPRRAHRHTKHFQFYFYIRIEIVLALWLWLWLVISLAHSCIVFERCIGKVDFFFETM